MNIAKIRHVLYHAIINHLHQINGFILFSSLTLGILEHLPCWVIYIDDLQLHQKKLVAMPMMKYWLDRAKWGSTKTPKQWQKWESVEH